MPAKRSSDDARDRDHESGVNWEVLSASAAKKAKMDTDGAIPAFSGGKSRSRSGSDTSDTALASSDDDYGDASPLESAPSPAKTKPVPRRYPLLSPEDLAKAKSKYGVHTARLITRIQKYDEEAVAPGQFFPGTEKMLAILAYWECD